MPSSDPPAKTWRKVAPSSDVKPTAVGLPLVTVVTSTDRDLSDAALSSVVKLVSNALIEANWQKGHTDTGTAFKDLADVIHSIVKTFSGPVADEIVDLDQFKENVTKKSASGFVDLLRKALKENNREFWRPIVTMVRPLT